VLTFVQPCCLLVFNLVQSSVNKTTSFAVAYSYLNGTFFVFFQYIKCKRIQAVITRAKGKMQNAKGKGKRQKAKLIIKIKFN
jgi:hypothetical protein